MIIGNAVKGGREIFVLENDLATDSFSFEVPVSQLIKYSPTLPAAFETSILVDI